MEAIYRTLDQFTTLIDLHGTYKPTRICVGNILNNCLFNKKVFCIKSASMYNCFILCFTDFFVELDNKRIGLKAITMVIKNSLHIINIILFFFKWKLRKYMCSCMYFRDRYICQGQSLSTLQQKHNLQQSSVKFIKKFTD